MAFVRFNVEISGEKQLVRRLQNLSSEIDDFKKSNEVVYVQVYVPYIRRRFSSSGDGTWKKLTPEYEIEKAKRYGTKPLNRATDGLYFSLTGVTIDTIKEIDKFSATFGSKKPYFRHVQRERPIVEKNPTLDRDIKTVFMKDLTELKNRYGLQ